MEEDIFNEMDKVVIPSDSLELKETPFGSIVRTSGSNPFTGEEVVLEDTPINPEEYERRKEEFYKYNLERIGNREKEVFGSDYIPSMKYVKSFVPSEKGFSVEEEGVLFNSNFLVLLQKQALEDKVANRHRRALALERGKPLYSRITTTPDSQEPVSKVSFTLYSALDNRSKLVPGVVGIIDSSRVGKKWQGREVEVISRSIKSSMSTFYRVRDTSTGKEVNIYPSELLPYKEYIE